MRNLILLIIGCIVTYSCHTTQEVVQVAPNIQPKIQQEQVLKRKVAIARFSNETQYAKGIFYEKRMIPLANKLPTSSLPNLQQAKSLSC